MRKLFSGPDVLGCLLWLPEIFRSCLSQIRTWNEKQTLLIGAGLGDSTLSWLQLLGRLVFAHV